MASDLSPRQQLDRARAALRTRGQKERALEQAIVRKAVVGMTAAGFGVGNRLGLPVSIGGFPWKLGIWGLATIGEALTRGTTRSILGGVSDATMAVYVERSISTNSIVAGDGDYDDGGTLVEGVGDGGQI